MCIRDSGRAAIGIGHLCQLFRVGHHHERPILCIDAAGAAHGRFQQLVQCFACDGLVGEFPAAAPVSYTHLLPLQSGRLLLPARLTPNDLCYLQAAACLREVEEANRAKLPGYELLVKGALLRFLSLLIAQGKQLSLIHIYFFSLCCNVVFFFSSLTISLRFNPLLVMQRV